ncbi:MAG: anthranilate phosphoribosyltransferase [Alphaproteobacteria bacterium]
MSEGLKPYIHLIVAGETLSEDQAMQAVDCMMAGDATLAQMGAFLSMLRLRGETSDELTGAAKAMQKHMVSLPIPPNLHIMDIVGTGGDRSGSYNISTTTAFVVAACGVPVAKHGNRAASSKSGSADVLTALGFDLDAPFEQISKSIEQTGFGFMLAQRHHAAIRNVMPARVELAMPTLFNFLGPLCNPARVKLAMIGCFDPAYMERMARTASALGMDRVMVVNGQVESGTDSNACTSLDEVSLSGSTSGFEMINGALRPIEITPELAGMERLKSPQIKGGSASENASAMLGVLGGDQNDYRQMVLINSAAALLLAEQASSLKQGVQMAAQAIDQGAALDVLTRARAITPL